MHIRINHSTRYTYERPVRSLGQMLRVTPRPTSGQTVRSWRVATVPFLPLRTAYDAFGNVVTLLFTDQPLRALDIEVSARSRPGTPAASSPMRASRSTRWCSCARRR